MNRLDGWRAASSDLRGLISDASGSSQQTFCWLVQELNEHVYPVDGLCASVSLA